MVLTPIRRPFESSNGPPARNPGKHRVRHFKLIFGMKGGTGGRRCLLPCVGAAPHEAACVPEFPGLMAASVWMTSRIGRPDTP